MAFDRPTLSTLITRAENDLVSRLQIVTTVLRHAFLRVVARVTAGLTHGLYGKVLWASRQILVSTADNENLGLHGAEYKIPQKVATFALGNVTFTGTNDKSVPSDVRLLRSDGVEYATTTSGIIASGALTIQVRATVAGTNGNAEAGVTLRLVSAVDGVTSTATVAVGGIANGLDTEADEDYRARILARKQNPPQGGSKSDYERWAKEVAGVTRAFPVGNFPSAGNVTVLFVLDGLSNIIPDSAKVAEVQAYLTDPSRQIICATPIAAAPTGVARNFTLHVVPDNSDVRAAVQAELRDLLFRLGSPGSTITLGDINDAISSAAGETSHTLSVPSADLTHTATQIPTFGTLTFT